MQFICNHIEKIIGQYSGNPPLAHFLKDYFKQHKQLGSRDRKAISEGVYIFYRLAKFVEKPKNDVLNIVKNGIEICNSSNRFLCSALEKLRHRPIPLNFEKPYKAIPLSASISADNWKKSMLQQPDVFIRIVGNKQNILRRLDEDKIAYKIVSDACLSLENGSKIDSVLSAKDYVVQDWTSQNSLQLLFDAIGSKPNTGNNLKVWDTCAGAGGKMLLLKNKWPDAQVLSTDVRPTILHNLRERAKNYGYNKWKTLVVDAANEKDIASKINGDFDIVISDVPCTGSGTWARTPERFYFFEEKEIAEFSKLQFQIANNACKKTKNGGYFLYITCSVFAVENENITAQLLAHNPQLKLIAQQIINGIEMQSDSMFAALFKIME